MEPDRPQHERPVACVIAHLHSSATLVSMHFNSRTEKFGGAFQKTKSRLIVFAFLYFFYAETENAGKSVHSHRGAGGGERKSSYSRSTPTNVESQTDLI